MTDKNELLADAAYLATSDISLSVPQATIDRIRSAAAELDTLRAQVAALRQGRTWTRNEPGFPGFYWWRAISDNNPAIVKILEPIEVGDELVVSYGNGYTRLISAMRGEWCGPLLAPSDGPLSAWLPIETYRPGVSPQAVLVSLDGIVGEAHLCEGYGWYCSGNDPTDSWGGEIHPTHWQPLPSPPKEMEK